MSINGNIYYVTKEGWEVFKKEHEQLQKLKEAKMREETPPMMHSEEINPEYLSFQEDLELLENRLTELDAVIRNAEIIQPPPSHEQHIVKIGATVAVDVDGRSDEFTIVGSMEANPSAGRISYESPVGGALLNRQKEEEVHLSHPIQVIYVIRDIRYEL